MLRQWLVKFTAVLGPTGQGNVEAGHNNQRVVPSLTSDECWVKL